MTTDQSAPQAESDRKTGRTLGILFLVIGVLTLGAGILAIVYPDVTLLVISLLAGINLIVFSSLDLAEVIIDDESETSHRILSAVLGIMGLILGLIVLRHPFNSLAVLILALGIYLVVAGVIGSVRAIGNLDNRAVKMLVSLATLAAGVLILALPQLSLVTLAVLTGIGLIARGIGAIVIGLLAIKSAKPQDA